MQVMEAQVVDATHLELTRPIQVPCGARVLVSIATADVDKEHAEWVQMSRHQIRSAYGPDEPEYSVTRIKTPNPEFES